MIMHGPATDGLGAVLTAEQRIHPTPATAGAVQRTPLSIVDSTTATLGAASALWVFDAAGIAAPVDTLLASLRTTLAAYRHFAGRLQLTPWPAAGADQVPHTQRFRRSVVDYGGADDPGVGVQLATLATTVDALFPAATTRGADGWCWDLAHTDLMALFSPTGALAGGLTAVPSDTPAVRLRITSFECGGVALATRFAHPLADAEAMIGFVRAWAAHHSALVRGDAGVHASAIQPLFDPSLLDRCAAGNIDGPACDAGLVHLSRALPLPRYDWWAHEPGRPAYMDASPQVVVPAEIPEAVAQKRWRGRRIPWEEWETAKPVNHRVYRIYAAEVQSLFDAASSSLSSAASSAVLSPSPTISRHDVLLAFIWQLTARAKPPGTWPAGLEGLSTTNSTDLSEATISLDTTLGLRARLGLPANFCGSPVLLAGMSRTYAGVTGRSPSIDTGDGAVLDPAALAATAAAIRAHLAAFDAPALAAWLHEQAHELAPQRTWNGFLGARHTLATSWVRAGLWAVDFVALLDPSPAAASSLRWAGVLGPVLDGLVVLAEAPGPHAGRDWWRNGVDVDVKLETQAADRVYELWTRWRGEKAER